MFDKLAHKIPLHEAADFYYRIKNAGWADPPDMSGALEGQFNAPLEQALKTITSVVVDKFRLMVAYYTYGESMRDIAQHGIGEVFREHAGHELKAAEYYLKRAAVLGGGIHLDAIEPPPASTDPIHILQTMIRAEQDAIALQRQLHADLGDQNPMRIEVERILTEDQHHLDELWQMLPSEFHEDPAGQEAVEAPVPAQAAPKTASDKTPPTDAELKETGRQRAVAQLSAEAHRERGRRGERLGETAGRAAGAIGGAAAGRKLIGGGLGTVAGLAAGFAAGGKAGKELGVEHDIRKNAAAAEPTPEELAAIRKYHLASHFVVDPIFALTGATVGGALSRNPVVGALAGGALGGGLGAYTASTINRHTDKMLAKAQAGKYNLAAKQRELLENDALYPLYGMLGGVTGSIGAGVPGGAMQALANMNLLHKARGAQRALIGINERARGVDKEAAAGMRLKLAAMKLGFGPDIGTYMMAEQAGQQAQGQAEADFYREKLRATEQSSQATQQQLTDMQAQLQQLQEQAAQTGAAIQAANQEAVQARDESLAQTQAAANMRIGYQKLRQSIIDAASQDPEAMATIPGQLPPGSGEGMQPGMSADGQPAAAEGMMPGQPGADPQAVAPGQAPAGAGGPGAPGAAQNAAGGQPGPNQTAQGTSQMKTSGIANHAGMALGGAAGLAHGALKTYQDAQALPANRARLTDAAGKYDGSMQAAMDLAKAHAAVRESEAAADHPLRTGAARALRDGFAGAFVGDQVQRLGRNIRAL